jgi:two-component system response regulator FixJ
MPADGTVYVVDDDPAVRDSLAFLLGAAGLEVRLFESASAFLATLPTLGRGCVVTDVRMPEINGIELLRRMTSSGQALPVIVMTGHGDVPLAVEAMKLGALHFVEKPFEDERLLAAVGAALELDARTAAAGAAAADVVARIEALSGRERQVLDGLVAGHPNKLIARELGISPRTVEIYRANVMTKMQATSIPELVRLVMAARVTPR